MLASRTGACLYLGALQHKHSGMELERVAAIRGRMEAAQVQDTCPRSIDIRI